MGRMTGPQLSARTLAWFAVLTVATAAVVASQLGGQWTMGGQNASNTRIQSDETKIGVANASALVPKWVLNTAGDVSATPAVKDGAVYVPDWAGNVYAVDADTGAVMWQTVVSGVTGVPASDFQGGPGGIVRTTPAVAGNLLIMGDQGGRIGYGAKVFALDRKTGAARWVTQLQGNMGGAPGDQFAIVT